MCIRDSYGTDTKFDGYAKGCAFVLDGVPCEIVGSVIDKSQSQALIDLSLIHI